MLGILELLFTLSFLLVFDGVVAHIHFQVEVVILENQ